MKSPRKILTLRITAELDQRLTERANRLGISKNAYITTVLSNTVQSNECQNSATNKAETA